MARFSDSLRVYVWNVGETYCWYVLLAVSCGHCGLLFVTSHGSTYRNALATWCVVEFSQSHSEWNANTVDELPTKIFHTYDYDPGYICDLEKMIIAHWKYLDLLEVTNIPVPVLDCGSFMRLSFQSNTLNYTACKYTNRNACYCELQKARITYYMYLIETGSHCHCLTRFYVSFIVMLNAIDQWIFAALTDR